MHVGEALKKGDTTFVLMDAWADAHSVTLSDLTRAPFWVLACRFVTKLACIIAFFVGFAALYCLLARVHVIGVWPLASSAVVGGLAWFFATEWRGTPDWTRHILDAHFLCLYIPGARRMSLPELEHAAAEVIAARARDVVEEELSYAFMPPSGPENEAMKELTDAMETFLAFGLLPRDATDVALAGARAIALENARENREDDTNDETFFDQPSPPCTEILGDYPPPT